MHLAYEVVRMDVDARTRLVCVAEREREREGYLRWKYCPKTSRGRQKGAKQRRRVVDVEADGCRAWPLRLALGLRRCEGRTLVETSERIRITPR